MDKSEIALQLTLKALEEKNIALQSVASCRHTEEGCCQVNSPNAKCITDFYNTIFGGLKTEKTS